jgi:hypothetical protein
MLYLCTVATATVLQARGPSGVHTALNHLALFNACIGMAIGRTRIGSSVSAPKPTTQT